MVGKQERVEVKGRNPKGGSYTEKIPVILLGTHYLALYSHMGTVYALYAART
jgi:hypothetical protein